jgi:hypothetical protein
MIREFMDMLKYKRPTSSEFEEMFIDEFIAPLDVMEDKAGNLFKSIPYPNGDKPDIMFSSHTDTVHNKEGYQTLQLNGQYLKLSDKDSNCLGADDASGVWLMMEMIRAGKPALYVFHRGEEIGGVGSSFIANETPEELNGIKCCIALDRMGTRDVITHQGMSRCCSDEFAISLSSALGGKFAPNHKGVFTDSANYTDLIGECTNLSVGYEKQHSMFETQDFNFLVNLRLKLLALDYDKLVYSRDAGDCEYEKPSRYASTYDIDFKIDDYDVSPYSIHPPMEEMVSDYPDVIANILKDYGITQTEVADAIYNKTGDLA